MSCNKNPLKIKKMFNEISLYYDKMNNCISLGTHKFIKYLAIRELNIKPRSLVLDLCCGTGDFSEIIMKRFPRVKVIGLDFSPEMLKIAKQKNPNGVFMQGDCTKLPFSDNEFKYITMGFGLRNIERHYLALSEIYRVLDKDGKFLHLDFGKHNFISNIFDKIVPFMVKVIGENPDHYKYLLESKHEFPEPERLIKEIESHGFIHRKTCNYLFGAISAQIFQK